MIKEKCDRCGSFLGTESKKTKQRFCGNCKRKFQLQKYQKFWLASTPDQFKAYSKALEKFTEHQNKFKKEKLGT